MTWIHIQSLPSTKALMKVWTWSLVLPTGRGQVTSIEDIVCSNCSLDSPLMDERWGFLYLSLHKLFSIHLLSPLSPQSIIDLLLIPAAATLKA